MSSSKSKSVSRRLTRDPIRFSAESLERRLCLSVDSWRYAVSGNWSDPTLWSLGRVPTVTDDAVIATPGVYVVALNQDVAVNSLTLGGGSAFPTLDLQAPSSSTTVGIESAGEISIGAGSALKDTSVAGAAGQFDSIYGTLLNAGALSTAASRPLEIYPASGQQSENSGTITAAGADIWIDSSGSTFVNSGVIDIAAGQSLEFGSEGIALPSFDQDDGSIVANGTFEVAGATLVLNTDSISGTGSFEMDTATVELGTDVETGGVDWTLDQGTIEGPGTLTNSPGANLSAVDGTIEANFSNQGEFDAVQANVDGTLTTAPNSSIVLSGDDQLVDLTIANGFTNNGIIDLNSSSGSLPTDLSVTSGTLANADGAIIEVNSQATSGSVTIRASIQNDGTISTSGSQPLFLYTTAGVDSTNDGAINVSGGSFSLGVSNSTFSNGGAIDVQGAALNVTLSGGTFVNSGSLDVETGFTAAIKGGSESADSFNQSDGSLGGGGTFAFQTLTATLTDSLSSAGAALSFQNVKILGSGTLSNTEGQNVNLNQVSIQADFDNEGTAVLAGTVSVGDLQNQTGASLALMNSSSLTVADGISNSGTILVGGAADGIVVTTGFLVNDLDGVVLFQSSAAGRKQPYLQASFKNDGLIQSNGPAGLQINSAAGLNSSNSGTIFSDGGDLTIYLDETILANDGSISVSNGQLETIFNGSLGGAAELDNAAGTTLNLSSVSIASDVSNSGILEVENFVTINGTLTTGPDSEIKLSDNRAQIDPTLNLANSFTNYGVIDLASPSAEMSVNSGTITNATGAVIESTPSTLGRTVTASVYGDLVNDGAVSVGGSGLTLFDLSFNGDNINVGSGGTLTLDYSGVRVAGSGTLDVGQNGILVLSNATIKGSVTLAGTLQINGSLNSLAGGFTTTGDSVIDLVANAHLSVAGSFRNNGFIDLSNATLLTVTGGSLDNAAGATIDATQTGAASALTAIGIDGSLVNNGTLDVLAPSPLTISGNFTQGTVGQYFTQLPDPGLKVTGSAALAGTLAISTAAGFAPAAYVSYPVMTYSAVTGDFSHLSGNVLTGGITLVGLRTSNVYNLVRQQHATRLAIVQEPMATSADYLFNTIVVDSVDASGAVVLSDSSVMTLSIASGPAGGSLQGTISGTAIGGLDWISGWGLSLPGQYVLKITDAFDGNLSVNTVSFAVADSNLSGQFTTQPTKTVSGNSSSSVAYDLTNGAGSDEAAGTVSVTIYLSQSATNVSSHAIALGSYANDVDLTAGHTSAPFKITLSVPDDIDSGMYYFVATIGDNNSDITDTHTSDKLFASSAFNVSDYKLVFSTQPVDSPAGVPINPSVVVQVEDLDGQPATDDHSQVSLAIKSGPTGGKIGGTTSAAFVDGTATFSNLSFNVSGGYTLQASDTSGSGSVISTGFDVGPMELVGSFSHGSSTGGIVSIGLTPVAGASFVPLIQVSSGTVSYSSQRISATGTFTTPIVNKLLFEGSMTVPAGMTSSQSLVDSTPLLTVAGQLFPVSQMAFSQASLALAGALTLPTSLSGTSIPLNVSHGLIIASNGITLSQPVQTLLPAFYPFAGFQMRGVQYQTISLDSAKDGVVLQGFLSAQILHGLTFNFDALSSGNSIEYDPIDGTIINGALTISNFKLPLTSILTLTDLAIGWNVSAKTLTVEAAAVVGKNGFNVKVSGEMTNGVITSFTIGLSGLQIALPDGFYLQQLVGTMSVAPDEQHLSFTGSVGISYGLPFKISLPQAFGGPVEGYDFSALVTGTIGSDGGFTFNGKVSILGDASSYDGFIADVNTSISGSFVTWNFQFHCGISLLGDILQASETVTVTPWSIKAIGTGTLNMPAVTILGQRIPAQTIKSATESMSITGSLNTSYFAAWAVENENGKEDFFGVEQYLNGTLPFVISSPPS